MRKPSNTFAGTEIIEFGSDVRQYEFEFANNQTLVHLGMPIENSQDDLHQIQLQLQTEDNQVNSCILKFWEDQWQN